MALVIKSTNFSIAEAVALKMRGIQTDAYGEVLGGHKALFDFALASHPDSLAVNDEIPNLVHEADALVCTAAYAAGMTAAKGLVQSKTTAVDHMLLPDTFDFLNLGSEPSIVLSTWLTPDTPQLAGQQGIMGHTLNTSTYSQWYISTDSGVMRLAVNGGAYVSIPEVAGTPILLTFHIHKTGSGTFRFDAYSDATLNGGVDLTYPFIDPSGGATPTRKIGKLNYFPDQYFGVVHRLQLIKIDPDDFDIDAWLAAEISANSARF